MPFAFNSDAAGPENRRIARQELALNKKRLDAELVSKGYDPNDLSVVPGGTAEVEQESNKLMLQNMKAMQGKLAAQDSDKALKDFAHTGNTKYLQNALNNNPVLKKAWGDRGVLAISGIDFANDTELLAQKGFKPAEYDTEEKQNILKKNIYKTFNGKNWEVGLLNNAVAQTGTATRLGERDASVFESNHKELRDFMSGPRSSANTAEGHKYENEIVDAVDATDNKVPMNLIAAVMNQESSGNPNAVSPKGASRGFGLMQVSEAAAADVGMAGVDLSVPANNIKAGTLYLSKMLERYNGDTRKALAAYNAGPGNVDKYGGIPPFQETQQYVDKILNNFTAGESYYSAGSNAVQAGNDLPQNSLTGDIAREAKYADNRIATIQAFTQGNAAAAAGSSTELETRKVSVAEKSADASKLNALAKLKVEGNTSDQKNLIAAEQETQELLDNFGGEEAFFKTDFSDPKNFNKAWKNVVAINKLEGTELTAADRKSIIDVKGLIKLGETAIDISDDKTGLIDKQLGNLKAYMSDNVKGVAAKSAYQAFSNTLLHAFGGSNMTPAEIERFQAAYGSLGTQRGPVLAQFKTALLLIQSKLNSTVGLSNPYTSKVLVGADQERIASVISALDNTVEHLDALTDNNKTKNTEKLTNIFGGAD